MAPAPAGSRYIEIQTTIPHIPTDDHPRSAAAATPNAALELTFLSPRTNGRPKASRFIEHFEEVAGPEKARHAEMLAGFIEQGMEKEVLETVEEPAECESAKPGKGFFTKCGIKLGSFEREGEEADKVCKERERKFKEKAKREEAEWWEKHRRDMQGE